MRRESREIDRLSEEEVKAQEKAADDAAKAWDNFFKALNSALESQISALISEHERWGQAVKKTLDSLLVDVTKFFATWTLKAAENVAAQIAGDQALQTAQQASDMFGLGQILASASRAIAADAGVAAAGVAAQQAPLISPGALIEAAAVGSEVMGLAAFDTGAWQLPSDQIAMVHQNKLIMPAAEAGAFRNMLTTAAAQGKDGGGGNVAIHPTTHINVSAVDSAFDRGVLSQ
jgi:hypothetical protein